MLLLTGSCIVNESILTGESIPQIKDSAEYINEEEVFTVNKNKQCILFCGTEILQTNSENASYQSCKLRIRNPPPNNGCLALVLRTGYDTSKGKLIRTVISNTENLNIRQKDGLFVILFLLVCSIFTSIYVLNVGLEDEDRNKNKLFLRCILIITTVVPPELPMILTLAVNNSILYLQKKRIYVTEPQRIPEGGKVSTIAFDKTGTLTSDKFTFEGIVDDLSSFEQLKTIDQSSKASQEVLAGCQTLINVEGKLTGDPIELLFFESSTWE
jgi:cation-transporting ATPase 13A1